MARTSNKKGSSRTSFRKSLQIIKGLDLPTRPTVMMEVIKAQNAFAPDIKTVSEIISGDVAFAANVLKEANSALPGLKRQVASIQQAVALLGLGRVRQIIARLFLNSALIGKAGLQHQLRSRFYGSALVAGYLAEELPRISQTIQHGNVPAVPVDEAYTLGLFHDCGTSILLQKFPDYARMYAEAQASEETTLVLEETERYKTNHCVVGYLLCTGWQLPQSFCEVILHHHEPMAKVMTGKKVKDRNLATFHGILRLGELLSGELSPYEREGVKEEVLSFFGITEEQLSPLRDGVARRLEQSAALHD